MTRNRVVGYGLVGFSFWCAASLNAQAAGPGEDTQGVASSSPSQAKSSDRQVAQGVREALRKAGGIDMAALTVRVKNGIVTLAGSVPSANESARAADVSAKVSGATSVRNKLTVQTEEN
jgi:hyperosmotically inducible periplasmic protein